MISRIIIGLVITALGYCIVAKTNWFYDILGSIQWAERHLGFGSSRFAYKIIGITIILIGLLVVTDLFDLVIGSFIRSLFARP